MSAEKTILSQYIFQAKSFEAFDPDTDGKGEYRLTVSIRHNRMPDDSIEEALKKILGKKVSLLELYSTEKKPRIELILGAINGWAIDHPKLEATEGQKRGTKYYHFFNIPEGENEALSLCRRWKISSPNIDIFEENVDPNIQKNFCCPTCIKIINKRREKEDEKRQGVKIDSRGIKYIPDPKARRKEHRT